MDHGGRRHVVVGRRAINKNYIAIIGGFATLPSMISKDVCVMCSVVNNVIIVVQTDEFPLLVRRSTN